MYFFFRKKTKTVDGKLYDDDGVSFNVDQQCWRNGIDDTNVRRHFEWDGRGICSFYLGKMLHFLLKSYTVAEVIFLFPSKNLFLYKLKDGEI